MPFGSRACWVGHVTLPHVRLELTRRGSYAIRAVLTLSRAERDDVVPARRIAHEMHIPERFLPQVLGDLNRAGIVEARLGRAGGYRLARAARSISLLDIIEASEGDTRRQSCVLTGQPCGEATQPCDVHEMFCAAQEAILERLASTSIADILEDGHRPVGLAAVDAVPRERARAWLVAGPSAGGARGA